jgi:16S rRNA (uracil1498-N3)-methyltransferase
MSLFYAPDLLTHHVLPEEELQHCIRVLRKQQGDIINITDGKGYFYKAQIINNQHDNCRLNIIETIRPPALRQINIEIAIAPTKNMERIEWFVEKATEIGIDKITFLKTCYSERKEVKMTRIRKILISAMKQSFQAVLPESEEIIDFNQFIQRPFDGQKFIAHCHPIEKSLLSKACHKNKNVLILIGPEGDFSGEEIAESLKNGFQSISLGESRLRTETAALAACQTIHIINQL